MDAGAWGVLVAPAWVDGLSGGAVLVADDPLAALQALARTWRRELGSAVIAVTGSVGKTSTKDLIAAVLADQRSVVASRANLNTEIGMPLEILGAPEGTDVLVLEAAMRGFGQIAELAAICEPDVGVITNIGPVHLEQVGSLAGVARAKGSCWSACATAARRWCRPASRCSSPTCATGCAWCASARAVTCSSTATSWSPGESGSRSSSGSPRDTSG